MHKGILSFFPKQNFICLIFESKNHIGQGQFEGEKAKIIRKTEDLKNIIIHND